MHDDVSMRSKTLRVALASMAVVAIAIQLVPYGRDHSNPAIIAEPAWIGTNTRALAARACFDCHSNETKWPWYSHVAPISWLVQYDTMKGRSEMNFSEWGTKSDEADEAAEAVNEGEMPPAIYLVAHPEARLTASERTALIDGLNATFGSKDD